MINVTKNRDTVEGGRKPVFLSDLTKRFRIVLEEGSERGADHLGFCQLIPCKGFRPGPGQSGPFIALHSEDPPILMLYTDRVMNGKTIWATLKACPGTWADFHLDGEMVLFFPPSCLEVVGQMAGARRKRVLSAEQRVALIEKGKAGREALIKYQKQRVQVRNSTQDATIPPPAGN